MIGGIQMQSFADKLKIFKENKVVNWHEHVWADAKGNLNVADADRLVEGAKKAGFDVLVCSLPVTRGNPAPEMCKRYNDLVYEAMNRYPGIIQGMCYVNPGYAKEAVKEIDRCINELGMIGVKLYNQYYLSDPAVHSVIEKCIELDIPILEHAGKMHPRSEDQPFISDGTHFAMAAEKFPEALFIYAHIGGGGDYHWSLKAIADYPNIFLDISGSIYVEDIIEETVRKIGVERVMFGTDGSFSSSMGKLLGCKLSEAEKIAILNNKTMERYLERGMKRC
jgi:predicted TIM-barrel fold metal-dependent hydrolase